MRLTYYSIAFLIVIFLNSFTLSYAILPESQYENQSPSMIEVAKHSAAQRKIDDAFELIFKSKIGQDLCRKISSEKILVDFLGISEKAAYKIFYDICFNSPQKSDSHQTFAKKKYFFVDDSPNLFNLDSWTDRTNQTFLFIKKNTALSDLSQYLLHELIIAFNKKGRLDPTNGRMFFSDHQERIGPIEDSFFEIFLKESPFWQKIPPADWQSKERSPRADLLQRIDRVFSLIADQSIDLAIASLRALNYESALVSSKTNPWLNAELCASKAIELVAQFDHVENSLHNLNREILGQRKNAFERATLEAETFAKWKDQPNGAQTILEFRQDFISNASGQLAYFYGVERLSYLQASQRARDFFQNHGGRNEFIKVLFSPQLILPFRQPISFCQFLTEVNFNDLEIPWHSNEDHVQTLQVEPSF
jgi:hypothetical protein